MWLGVAGMAKDGKRRPPTARELCFLHCSLVIMMMMNEAKPTHRSPPSHPLCTGPARHHVRHVLPASEEQEQEPRALGKGNGGEAAGPARAS